MIAVDDRWLEAADEAAAVALLGSLGCTDGLPIVAPTPERVDAMLTAIGDLAPDDVLGVVPPRMGIATVRDVAACAVMAGVSPEHGRIVCAAVQAVCDARFALGVVQGTTHNAALLTIVNGPIVATLESGTGAFGPGPVGSGAIGRALRLVVWNAGGGQPGAGDMATLGQPAKFTCCVAEAEGDSPWSPLAHDRDPAIAEAGESAVTVLAAEGPSQVMFVPVGDRPGADAQRLLELLARTLAVPGSLAAMGYAGSGALLLCPLHARVLADAGYDRARIQAALFEQAAIPARDVRRLHGFVRGGDERWHDDDLVAVLASPEHLLVAVAGGPGTYSAVCCGLSAGVGDAVTVSWRGARPARHEP